jgi:hypothetical protein
MILVARPSHATIVPKLGWNELVEVTGYVVVARVDEATPGPSEAFPTRQYTLSIQEELLGTLGAQTFTLTLPGGPLPDGTEVTIVGAPDLVVGETYLLFLRNVPWTLTPVANWHHSAFREITLHGDQYFVDVDGRSVVDVDHEQAFILGGLLVGARQTVVNPQDPSSAVVEENLSPPVSDQMILEAAQDALNRADLLNRLRDLLPGPQDPATVYLSPSGSYLEQTSSDDFTAVGTPDPQPSNEEVRNPVGDAPPTSD